MMIREYTTYDGAEILPLYDSAGWTVYTKDPDRLAAAFAASLLTLAAYEDGKLVGIVRAVGDGTTIVFIQDLLVLPDFQRRGIGKELLKAVLDRFADVYQIQLTADDRGDLLRFYRSMGFQPLREMGCCGLLKVEP